MVSFDDAARILDFSTPVPLPGGGRWTARLRWWESDRMQAFEFTVTVTAPDGAVETFTALIPDAYDDTAWAAEPARARQDLDRKVRDKLGIPWHLPPHP